MITYFCKYTPLELMAALGASLDEPNRETADFRHADAMLHTSICTHAKLLLEECSAGSTAGTDLVLTNCCDSIRRVYDVVSADPALSEGFSSKFMMDLPHENFGHAVELWKKELIRLRDSYLAAHPDHHFDRAAFLNDWKRQADTWELFRERGPFIAIFGARVSNELRAKIRNSAPYPVIDLTCGGLRSLPQPPKEAFAGSCENCSGNASDGVSFSSSTLPMSDDDLLGAYAEALLHQLPCTRMEDVSERAAILSMKSMVGIVYHSVKFCDYYAFEYADIRRTVNIPILKLETDYTTQSEGQLETRLAAFAESLAAAESSRNADTAADACRSDSAAASLPGKQKAEKTARKKVTVSGAKLRKPSGSRTDTSSFSGDQAEAIYIGIDSGSTSTNIAAIAPDGTLLASAIVRTGARAGAAAQRAYDDVKVQLGRNASKIKRIIATGYGRDFISFADGTRTEISCHARGAHAANPEARCVIDIGGQDSKVICLDEDGNVVNFVMNDKCAAGTGRFLEMMAHTLETDLSSMSRLGLQWKKDLTISSTCTVFAESEVVSLIAENTDPSDIVHALNKAVAGRTAGMVKRVHGEKPFMMTGGVARNLGVAGELEKKLGASLAISEHPDLIGAIGAALFAASGQQ
ncbi:MAG: acyl-CoA dehydratase activase [Lachnospiraceae bacterium]|nr:acyl-CoA dehydratase activase [Lachnospiraceae bacterium]